MTPPDIEELRRLLVLSHARDYRQSEVAVGKLILALPALLAAAEENVRLKAALEGIEPAIRKFCDLHGPSGAAWNISSILDCIRTALGGSHD